MTDLTDKIKMQSDPEYLINRAFYFMKKGLHLQSRLYYEQAKSLEPEHPYVLKFFRVRNRRYEQHGEYYDEPEVSCCGCTDNLTDCACKLACCDACCIPGGCCGPC